MARRVQGLFSIAAIILFAMVPCMQFAGAQTLTRANNFVLSCANPYNITAPDGTSPRTYYITIQNTGNVADQYYVNITMDSNITLDAASLYNSPWPAGSSLGVMQSTSVPITVRAMPNAENKTHAIIVRVNNTGPQQVVKTYTIYLIVTLAPGVEVQAPPVQRGVNSQEICFYFNVTNTGNGLDSYNLKARSTMQSWGWLVRIESSGDVYLLANIARGAKQIVRVYLAIPEDASMQHPSCTVYLTANSTHDVGVMDEKSTTALLQQTHNIAVEATTELERSVMPDQSAVFGMNVINMGNGQEEVALSYEWVTSPIGWALPQVSPSNLRLNLDYKGTQGASKAASIEVKAPKASAMACYDIKLIATSLANSSVVRSITFKICVAAYYGVNMSIPETERRVEGTAGGVVEFLINVTNEGNGADTILFGIEDMPTGWTHEILLGGSAVNGVSLSYLETRQVKLVVHISENLSLARVGTYDFNFTIASQGNSSKVMRVTFLVDVLQKHGLEFRVESNFSVVNPFAGYAKAVFKTMITNTGNGPDDYDLVLAPGISKTWGSVPMMQAHVQPDDTQQVLLTVSVPTTAEKGDYVITLYAISSGDILINKSISVTVHVVKCDLAVQPAIVGVDDSVEQQISVPYGKQLTLWINVKNTGEEALTNVTVQFLDGDQVIGYSNISSIGVGDVQKASISWLATGYTNHRFSAVVDPFGAYPEMVESDNSGSVEILVLEEQNNVSGPGEETPWGAIIAVIVLISAVAAVALFVVMRSKKAQQSKKVDETLYASIYGKTPDGKPVENAQFMQNAQTVQFDEYAPPKVDVNSEEYKRIYGGAQYPQPQQPQSYYNPYPSYGQAQPQDYSSYGSGYNEQSMQPGMQGQVQYGGYDSYPTYAPEQQSPPTQELGPMKKAPKIIK